MALRLSPNLNLKRLAGQVLIVVGLASIGGWAWLGWGQNMMDALQQRQVASALGNAWSSATPAATPASKIIPVLGSEPVINTVFGRIFAPRLGENWVRPIADGVSVPKVLNRFGTGHYPESQLPGAIGNFAIAGHRTTYGAAFNDIDKFRVGDSIYIETKDGFYRYQVVRNFTVWPTNRSVIAANPLHPGLKASERWLTLTTCTPRYTAERRLVVQAKFESFTAHGTSAPSEIAKLVAQL